MWGSVLGCGGDVGKTWGKVRGDVRCVKKYGGGVGKCLG